MAVIKTDGVGSQVQAGLIPDLTVGPRGRVWLVAKKPHSSAYELQAVSPVTNAISSYSLADKSLGRLTYNGEITAGKSGTLWLSATKRSGAGVVIRYTPATRKLAEFGTPAACNGKDIYTEVSLYTASDGYVWLRCVSGSDNSVVERIASSGTSSRIRVPGKTMVFKLAIPAKSAVRLGLSPVGPPVITSNGAIWEEESAYPGTGQLVRFTP